MDRNNQKKKGKCAERIQQINKWEANIRDKQAAHGRAND